MSTQTPAPAADVFPEECGCWPGSPDCNHCADCFCDLDGHCPECGDCSCESEECLEDDPDE